MVFLPYLPLYIEQARMVRKLGGNALDLYVAALTVLWQHGPMPLSELQRHCAAEGVNGNRWNAAWPKLAPLFAATADGWTMSDLEDRRQAAADRSAKAKSKADARWSNAARSESSPPNSTPNPGQNPTVNSGLNPIPNSTGENDAETRKNNMIGDAGAFAEASAAAHALGYAIKNKKENNILTSSVCAEAQLDQQPLPLAEAQAATVPLWSKGLQLLAEITGRPAASCRPIMGRLRKSGTDESILTALRDAKREQPADPVPWIIARLTPRPTTSRQADPDDAWGVYGWCKHRGFGPTVTENDRKIGRYLAKIDGRPELVIDRLARDLAKAARLPRTWHGDWDVLTDWLGAGIRRLDILAAVERIAAWSEYDPVTIGSLRFFSNVVQQGVRRH